MRGNAAFIATACLSSRDSVFEARSASWSGSAVLATITASMTAASRATVVAIRSRSDVTAQRWAAAACATDPRDNRRRSSGSDPEEKPWLCRANDVSEDVGEPASASDSDTA
eukprot:scaffold209793_cov22-Tisochrysis_lutea.AAC.2